MDTYIKIYILCMDTYIYREKNVGSIPVIGFTVIFAQRGRCAPWTPAIAHTNPGVREDLEKRDDIFTTLF